MFENCPGHIKIIQQKISILGRNFEDFMLYLQTLDEMPENLILTEIWIVDSKVIGRIVR